MSDLIQFIRGALCDLFVSLFEEASSRVMSAISVSHLGCKDVDMLGMGVGGEWKGVGSWSLSLTLEKLYFWEKKLYGEVKVYTLFHFNKVPCYV